MSERPGLVRRVAGNATATALADIAGKLAVLATYAVVARDLGAAPLGELTFALSLAVLLQLAGLGTDSLIAREAARNPQVLREMHWNVLGLKLLLGGIATLAVVLLALLGDFGPQLRLLLILLIASGLIDLVASTWAWMLRGLEEMVVVAASQLLQRLCLAIAAIVAMLVFGAGVEVVGAAYVLGSLAGAAVLVARLGGRVGWRAGGFSPARAWGTAVASLPLAATAALATALARLDAILLTALSTLATVGLYGAAYRLIESTFFVGYAFGIAVYPMLSRLGPDTNPSLGRVFAVAARFSLAGMLPVGAVFILFPAPLIELIYGSGFGGAIEPTRWLGVVAALNGLTSLALFVLAARDLRRAILIACLAALVVNVMLNFALIPVYGATGAAIAMAAAYVVLTVIGIAAAVRRIGPLSAVRLLSLTGLAFGAMALARVVLGETWLGLAAGLAAYGVAVVLGHHGLFRGDTRLLRQWLSARRPSAAAGP